VTLPAAFKLWPVAALTSGVTGPEWSRAGVLTDCSTVQSNSVTDGTLRRLVLPLQPPASRLMRKVSGDGDGVIQITDPVAAAKARPRSV
jgi:hypothetical protein